MTEHKGKNGEDWVIRSQAPKAATQGYGEGSTTLWVLG